MVQLFGAPNGLCSSIVESKHIRAVKKPWRKSNKHHALGQMLLTNQHLDKLARYKAEHLADGLLDGPLVPDGVEAEPFGDESDTDSKAEFHDDSHLEEEEDVDGDRTDAIVELAKIPSPRFLQTLSEMGANAGHPELPDLVAIFLFQQRNPGADEVPDASMCPQFTDRGFSYTSAVATFYAPSELSGANGMWMVASEYDDGGDRLDLTVLGEEDLMVACLSKILREERVQLQLEVYRAQNQPDYRRPNNLLPHEHRDLHARRCFFEQEVNTPTPSPTPEPEEPVAPELGPIPPRFWTPPPAREPSPGIRQETPEPQTLIRCSTRQKCLTRPRIPFYWRAFPTCSPCFCDACIIGWHEDHTYSYGKRTPLPPNPKFISNKHPAGQGKGKGREVQSTSTSNDAPQSQADFKQMDFEEAKAFFHDMQVIEMKSQGKGFGP
ncbi:hypothetical protein HYDPIDRAFT_33120 [Hydnomerulius pinastri MD-312]|uniref:Uncharacterized protein n=1 Tax=Hydnomerulius pinastri MD-312 TaxID=994086 RepID=A0A0C9VP88_9AGAM|nr:hypothetical protein HYDPIDRAFT_33120 [Hydnomerulius pinastri MD-312]